ncbi:hypothetical protein [Jiangella gansuensis]|uniref:hypothetical protein n=1 Tax=Jiangella gansuensis TaxID=281473 RepID=UPI00047E0DEC|nr:hypothetical protein [Jiangella gansuensis]
MTAFNEIYQDVPEDFELSELEQAQAASIQQMERELAELKAQAANPATGAVEQPAQRDDSAREAALEALGNARTREEQRAAVAAYNAAVAPSKAPVVPRFSSPAEARQFAEVQDGETKDEYYARLRSAGLATGGYVA